MIEFNGYITGTAEKHFWKKSQKIVQNALLVALLIFLPIIINVAVVMQHTMILTIYCTMFIIIPLLVKIPKSKKEKMALTPKKIVIDGKRIVCIADKYTETRLIDDVKSIYDFGEFYEIVFPFGKMSEKFICQKDLLIKGSLGEFQRMFKGKIK